MVISHFIITLYLDSSPLPTPSDQERTGASEGKVRLFSGEKGRAGHVSLGSQAAS